MTRPTLYCGRFLLPIKTPPLEDGAMLVEGAKIRAVGRRTELNAVSPKAQIVDFGDAVLLPPLVNAHTHLELSDFPGWAEAAGESVAPESFVDWILWLVRVRRSVSDRQLHDALSAGLQASLCAGTGAIGDILTTLDACQAYRDIPLRGRVFAEVLGHDPVAIEARLEIIEELAQNPPAASLDWGLSPHAPYTLSTAAMDKVLAFANRCSLPSAIHLAESTDETSFLRDGSGAIAERLYASARWRLENAAIHGCSPVRGLCRQGGLGRNDLLVHGVQVDGDDIELIGKAGCSVVLCPRSNAALKVGQAPLDAYLRAGIPLALGTDSLASAPSLSIWEEMAFARQWFAGAASPRAWLAMATLGGARALGLQGGFGQLAAGSEASFQVVELTDLPGMDSFEEALCSAGRDARVSHLFLANRNVLPNQ